MRASNEEKGRSRIRILEAAARLLRERGLEGASVGEIMREAGMTHGGFYRHFESKDALLSAALSQAFATFAQPMLDASGDDAHMASMTFSRRYLSADHLVAPGEGCPAAALGPEIARANPEVQTAFRDGVERILEGLARGTASDGSAREDALCALSMMLGAVILARGAGEPLAAEVLKACSGRIG